MTDPVDKLAIETAIDAIARSGALGTNSRLNGLLRYVVNEELAGRGDRIKAYSIATSVFGRGIDFDASTDSIVRVEVRRLRQALDYYYATDGSADQVKISIPSGGYRPVFHVRTGLAETRSEDSPPAGMLQDRPRGKGILTWARVLTGVAGLVAVAAVSLLVWSNGTRSWSTDPMAILNSSWAPDDPDAILGQRFGILVSESSNSGNYFTQPAWKNVMQQELRAALSKQKTFLVFTERPSAGGGYYRLRMLYFVLTLNADESPEGATVSISLSSSDGIHFWTSKPVRIERYQRKEIENAVTELLSQSRPQLLLAAKKQVGFLGQEFIGKSDWDLYVQAAWAPASPGVGLEWQLERIELAKQALDINSSLGQANAILAHSISSMAVHDASWNTPEREKEAEEHAIRALANANFDSDAMFYVARYFWSIGKMDQSADVARRAVELDPTNVMARVAAEHANFTCEVAPFTARERLSRINLALSPENPQKWMALTALAHFSLTANKKDEALRFVEEANAINWSADTVTLHAALLHDKGEKDKAQELLKEFKLLWPGYSLRNYVTYVSERRCPGGEAAPLLKEFFTGFANQLEPGP
jgi:tetratricopeptide (TPR) repeat protein